MPRRKDVYKLYSVKDLVELQDNPDQWIVEDMIPRIGRVLAYGRGGDFKTSLIFDLAVAVASGGRLLDRMAVIRKFGPVVLLSTEGSIYTNRDRLLAYMRSRNLEHDTIPLFYGRQPLELQMDGDLSTLRKIIEKIKPVMVVLDPLVSFCGGNENDTNEMKNFVKGLDELIDEYETAVVIIHHANKAAEMRGSSVLQGWADSILKFEVKRDAEIKEAGQKVKVPIITITGEKQRDGQTGPLLSAVPFFDKELRMTSFGFYDGKDANGVIVARLKMDILKNLRRTMTTLSASQIAGFHKRGWERTMEALDWLQLAGLIELVAMRRSTGGKRSRDAGMGYMAAGIGTKIDAAQAIFEAERRFGLDANEGEPG